MALETKLFSKIFVLLLLTMFMSNSYACDCLRRAKKIKLQRPNRFLHGHCYLTAFLKDKQCAYNSEKAKKIFSDLYYSDEQDLYGMLSGHKLAGMLLYTPKVSAQSAAAAREILQNISEKGFKPAYNEYGQLLYEGIGGKKEKALGMKWLEKAMEYGDKRASAFIETKKIKTGN